MGGRTRNSTPKPGRAATNAVAIADLLAEKWPDAVVELDHRNAYELLVATILAAQSTDKMINTITPALFAKYPDPASLAAASPEAVEPMIFKSGFYRNKAKSIIGMARAVVERHGGLVPDTMEALVELPGVARKTANVVLGSAFGKNEGVVVDTHVTRLAQRLGLTTNTDPVKIEQDLMQQLPREQWTLFAHRLIWHGRRVCHAKQPDHDHCLLAPLCPTAALVQLAPPSRAAKPGTTKARATTSVAAKRARQAITPTTSADASLTPTKNASRTATAKNPTRATPASKRAPQASGRATQATKPARTGVDPSRSNRPARAPRS